jgi:anti-sigma factor ChrR (cupin superfamily)
LAQFEQLRPVADVRRNEEYWVNSGVPGIDIKQLFQEKETGRSTYLVRMEPGKRLPAHYHPDAEQCLVLKGDIAWGDIVYEEGDFIVMGKGTHHPEIPHRERESPAADLRPQRIRPRLSEAGIRPS